MSFCSVITASIPFFSSACGAAIGASLGYVFNYRLERHRRIAAIKGSVFLLQDSFDPEGDIQKFHSDSIPVLRETISQLIPFLPADRAEKLNSVWQAYRNIPARRLKSDLYTNAGAVFEKAMGRPSATAAEVVTSMLGYLNDQIRNA